MNIEYPGTFARFYDQIYHFHRDSVDTAWFQEQIRSAGGKILEVGCGTGRMLITALSAGADIYGIDISQSMIDVLHKKLGNEDHYRISRQNMIDFKLDMKFDLIIAPFRVMMHVLTKEDQMKAIRNIFNHLSKGGKFIFDAFVPDLNHLIRGFDNYLDYEGEYMPGKVVRRYVSSSPDLISQTITVTFRIEWDEDDLTRTEEWTTPMRFFFRYELEHLIERSEFSGYKILGDYNGSDLNSQSKEFIVICEK